MKRFTQLAGRNMARQGSRNHHLKHLILIYMTDSKI
jgi:hypothetical protein